jgi:DNA-binding NarL/FixJ family response regulator
MRIVLIAGEPLFRLGFKALLASSDDLQLIGEAHDARSAFPVIDADRPDLVVMDIALRGMSGVTAAREIKCRAPDTRILLLSAWARERDALDGFTAGAHGFALKSEAPESLLYALRTVGRGHAYVTPELRGCGPTLLDGRRARPAAGVDVLAVLSPREREVLDLIIKGWRNRNIARELCISIKTVDTHRTRINRKLRCTNAADLVRFAADNGLLRMAPGQSGLDLPALDAHPEHPEDQVNGDLHHHADDDGHLEAEPDDHDQAHDDGPAPGGARPPAPPSISA